MSVIRRRDFLDKVRATYWFVPLLMSVGAALLAAALIVLDLAVPNSRLAESWLILHVPPASVPTLLTGLAGTALGVVGVVFSITLVPLSIASSQYGPIILRSFLRDRSTQVVLGTYSAEITYTLVLVLLLPPDLTDNNVPQIAVTVAFLLSLISLAMLVYFFHHVAVSLQASTVVEGVSEELMATVRTEYPEHGTQEPPAAASEALLAKLTPAGQTVTATGVGYVRDVDIEQVVKTAAEHDLVVWLQHHAGDFVQPGLPLLRFRPASAEGDMDKATADSLPALFNRSYLLGSTRTMFQDVEFGISLLVVVASRALSPAINDPVTPLMCVDRLGAALALLAGRHPPQPYYCDSQGRVRVFVEPVSFEGLVGSAFNLIREYGRGNAELLMRMFGAIGRIAEQARTDEQRQVLAQHAQLILGDSLLGLPSPYDQERVRQAHDQCLTRLEMPAPTRQVQPAQHV